MLLQDLIERHRGIRVIGDVHGHLAAFEAAVAEARAKDHGILLVGDLIDKGDDSPGCMQLALELVARGEAVVTPGNHELKLHRYLSGEPIELEDDGLGGTFRQLARRADGPELLRRFAGLVARLPLWQAAGPFVFAHAAWAPDMRLDAAPLLGDVAPRDRVCTTVTRGERGARGADGRKLRSYFWIDAIPGPHGMMIGHDCFDNEQVVTREGAQGARLFHLDLGITKGGRLGHVDLPKSAFAEPAPHGPLVDPILVLTAKPLARTLDLQALYDAEDPKDPLRKFKTSARLARRLAAAPHRMIRACKLRARDLALILSMSRHHDLRFSLPPTDARGNQRTRSLLAASEARLRQARSAGRNLAPLPAGIAA